MTTFGSHASARDLDLLGAADAAFHERSPRSAMWLIVVMTALVASFVAWASWAMLDEVTRGDGQIVPSSKRQVVQSLEGGIVKELNVREGDRVHKGQVLLQIDDTGFSSNFGELESKSLVLKAQLARLLAEVDSAPLQFPAETEQYAAGIVANETSLHAIRQSNLASQVNVLKERLQQKHHELRELHASRDRQMRGLALGREEMRLKEPTVRSGVVPKTDKLVLDRLITDLEGQIATINQSIPRVESGIREVERMLEEQALAFRRDAQKELNERRAELMVVEQTLKASRDRVVRSDIRSPVSGIVNKLNVTTVGGVVKGGDALVEITPLEDQLLVQAKIRPQDIAFVRPGLKALVKITAYDFAIYGGLEGKVEIISSDSIYDEAAKEPFYHVAVRAERMTLQRDGIALPIIPGMVATVDILTGEKTVMDYILKPIRKAQHEALRER